MMLVPTRVAIFQVFVWCLAFLKYSRSEKPEDCKKGKQYWSVSDIISSGTCAPCPPDWNTCFGQPADDQASCLRSCRVVKSEKPKTKPKTNVTTVISVGSTSSKAPKVTNNSNASSPVVYKPPVHPPETEVDEPKSPDAKESLDKKILIVVVSCSFGLILLIAIGTILLYRKIKKKNVQNQGEGDELDEEEQRPLQALQGDRNDRELQDEPDNASGKQPDIVANEEELRLPIAEEQQRPIVHESSIKQQPIVQASGTNIDETQDTEELNFSSNLKLDEEES